ncbi:unnamed protein product, partial [Adineta steineri]
YKFICYSQSSSIRIDAITCEKILQYLSFTDYVIGKSKIFLKLEHLEILNQYYEQYLSHIIKCQKIVRGFLLRQKLLRQAKQNANERQNFLNQIYLIGKKTMDKLTALPKIPPKNIQQTSSSSGHFLQKRKKDSKKPTSSTSIPNETIPMSEQEHKDMLKVAKKLQLIEKDELDELDSTHHQTTSNDFKPTLERLSEREVRILVQEEFTPGTIMSRKQQIQQKKIPMEANIESGSGLPCTTTIIQSPSK